MIKVSTLSSWCFLVILLFAISTFFSFPAQATIHTTAEKTGLTPEILKYAVNAYRWAIKHHQVRNASVLTVVNFNEPSFKKRLTVIDLKTGHILMHTYVAQGRNTGAIYAKRFSNQPGSHESSPGVFTTANVYNGKHGESLRMNGLEEGINNNALNRAIVIHPATYVTPTFIKQNGYAGRSWGCFAVNPAHAAELIHFLKGGSVLFAYASPEKYDARVDHALSSAGEELYDEILGSSDNPIERFFKSLS